MSETPAPLVCAECGRPLKPIGDGARVTHAGGGPVAACDLDADHRPRPPERAGPPNGEPDQPPAP